MLMLFFPTHFISFQVYMAVEDIDSRVDSCYDMCHPVDVKVLDLYRNSVIYFNRSVSCLLQTIEVSSSPEGQVIGSIREGLAWWGECYKIKNRNGETVLRIEGPSCLCSCGSNINFKVNFDWVTNCHWQLNWHSLMKWFFSTDSRYKWHGNRSNIEQMVRCGRFFQRCWLP